MGAAGVDDVLAIVLRGDVSACHALRAWRADSGCTLLHVCARYNAFAPLTGLLRALPSLHACVNRANVAGWTPLHEACAAGAWACACALLQAGAWPLWRDARGRTPFIVAHEFGHALVARLVARAARRALAQSERALDAFRVQGMPRVPLVRAPV